MNGHITAGLRKAVTKAEQAYGPSLCRDLEALWERIRTLRRVLVA